MIYGDAEDPEIWERVDLDRIEVVILSVPDFEARVSAVEGLRKRGFTGVIGTISMYPEEEEPLREAGADLIRHPLSEAGFGLAEQSLELRAPARCLPVWSARGMAFGTVGATRCDRRGIGSKNRSCLRRGG